MAHALVINAATSLGCSVAMVPIAGLGAATLLLMPTSTPFMERL